jgi:hypothetical protein
MKINFKHPGTQNSTSVVLPDIWLRSWYLANDSQPCDVPDFVYRLACEFHFDREDACDLVGFVPATFTQYCEAILSMSVYDSLLLSLDLSGVLQSRLIATPSNGKAFSGTESKIRGQAPSIQSNL